jgi:hypothetical protein
MQPLEQDVSEGVPGPPEILPREGWTLPGARNGLPEPLPGGALNLLGQSEQPHWGLRLVRHETAKAGQAHNRRFCLEVPIATIFDFRNCAISLLARPQHFCSDHLRPSMWQERLTTSQWRPTMRLRRSVG